MVMTTKKDAELDIFKKQREYTSALTLKTKLKNDFLFFMFHNTNLKHFFVT